MTSAIDAVVEQPRHLEDRADGVGWATRVGLRNGHTRRDAVRQAQERNLIS